VKGASSFPATAVALLGVALGGFFDGILLHQILQWHHLLSGLEGRSDDLAFQIAADGWFHIATYVLLAVALVMLWRARASLGQAPASAVLGWALIGFGAWHVLDAVAAHWVLQIHRIKMDAASRLLWDLAWLAAFGLLPIALGVWRLATPGGRSGRAAAAVIAALAAGAGAIASRPPPGQDFTVVVFRDGLAPAEAFARAASAGKAVLWLDKEGRVAVISGAGPVAQLQLYGRGAILTAGGVLPAGCFGWSDALA
jgi:uncharacterized membrane protein